MSTSPARERAGPPQQPARPRRSRRPRAGLTPTVYAQRVPSADLSTNTRDRPCGSVALCSVASLFLSFAACGPPNASETESTGTTTAEPCPQAPAAFCRSAPIDRVAVAAGEGGFAIVGEGWPRPLGDVNGDGLDDLALGSFVVFSELGSSPLVADPDILSQRGFAISWAYDEDDGSPAPRAAGDVNGDGLADMIVDKGDKGRVWIVFGKEDLTPVDLDDVAVGLGGFVVTETAGTAFDTPLGDVDGDGLADLALRVSVSDETRVIRGRTDGELVPLATTEALATVSGWGSFTAGDLDADGVDDLAICGGEERFAVLSAPDGWDAPLRRTTSLGHFCGWGNLRSGDLNGDGVDDLAFDANVDAIITAIVPGPLTLDGAPKGDDDLSGYFGGPSGAVLADVDGDGDVEAILIKWDDGPSNTASLWALRLEEIDPPAPWGCAPLGDLLWDDGDPWVIPLGDVDGDGKTDLFANSGSVVITEVCDLAP